jgi:hypothetical protein
MIIQVSNLITVNQNHRLKYSFSENYSLHVGRLCGLVISIEDYKHRGPGFDSRALLRIFLREMGLEWGPLSLVVR